MVRKTLVQSIRHVDSFSKLLLKRVQALWQEEKISSSMQCNHYALLYRFQLVGSIRMIWGLCHGVYEYDG